VSLTSPAPHSLSSVILACCPSRSWVSGSLLFCETNFLRLVGLQRTATTYLSTYSCIFDHSSSAIFIHVGFTSSSQSAQTHPVQAQISNHRTFQTSNNPRLPIIWSYTSVWLESVDGDCHVPSIADPEPRSPTRRLVMFSRLVICLLPLILPTLALPQPSIRITNPLSDQIISVGRLGHDFTFTFAADTFTVSPSHTVTYAAYGVPDWLSFDATARTFTGKPATERDVGIYPVQIIASLDAGRLMQAFDTITFIATSDPIPILYDPLTVQITPNSTTIASATAYPSGTAYFPGVNVPNEWSFSLGLEAFTFADPDGKQVYYQARTTTGGKLPPWLLFDDVTVTFYGVAPSESEVLEIVVYGSDRLGYADVNQVFFLVVGSSPTEGSTAGSTDHLSLNVAAGYPLRNVSLASIGGLDLVAGRNVTVDTSACDWLAYNNVTGTFDGTPPVQAVNSVSPLVLTTGNGTLINITLGVWPFIFINNVLPNGNVAANGYVYIPLVNYIDTTRSPVITMIVEPSVDWLEYDPTSQSINGIVPSNSSINIASVIMTALDTGTNATSYATLNINLQIPPPPLSITSKSSHGLSREAKVALIILGAFIGFFTLLCMVGTFLRRCSTLRELENLPYRPPNPTPEGRRGEREVLYEPSPMRATDHSTFSDLGIILRSSFGHRPAPSTKTISYPRALQAVNPYSPAVRKLTTIGEEHEATDSPSGSSDSVGMPDDTRDSIVSFYTGQTPDTLRREREARTRGRRVSSADSERFKDSVASPSQEEHYASIGIAYSSPHSSVQELEAMARPAVVSGRTTWSTDARSMASTPGFS
jgi:hypothetical protein